MYREVGEITGLRPSIPAPGKRVGEMEGGGGEEGEGGGEEGEGGEGEGGEEEEEGEGEGEGGGGLTGGILHSQPGVVEVEEVMVFTAEALQPLS